MQDSVKLYLKEISKYPLLTEREEVELAKQIVDGDEVAKQQFIESNLRLVVAIAKRYIGSGVPFLDLIQEGNLGLMKAVDKYDYTQGFKFSSYATHWIKQSIVRHLSNNSRPIRIPEYMVNLVINYKNIVKEYKKQYHREPTDKELCTALEIDFKQLEEVKTNLYKYDYIKSLDKPIENSEGDSTDFGNSIPSDTNVEDEVLDHVMDQKKKKELWQIVERECTETENKVINSRYKGDKTYKECGREINVTLERARLIEGNAIRKLRVPRVRRELENKFEINMAQAYKSGVGNFKRTWTSSTERAALRNLEAEQEFLHSLMG